MSPRTDGIPDHAVLTEVRVRYAETDQMGVVYYANYPVWFEVGRAAFLRERGMPYGEWEAAGYILPVSTVGYRLYASARYDDLVTVATWIDRVRSRSVHFRYHVLRDDRLLAEGETTHICVDRNRKPTTLPDRYRSSLEPPGKNR